MFKYMKSIFCVFCQNYKSKFRRSQYDMSKKNDIRWPKFFDLRIFSYPCVIYKSIKKALLNLMPLTTIKMSTKKRVKRWNDNLQITRTNTQKPNWNVESGTKSYPQYKSYRNSLHGNIFQTFSLFKITVLWVFRWWNILI